MSRDSEDNGNDSVPGWIERLGRAFGGEPRSREGLIEVMRDMSEQALIEPYTLAMLEGALKVSEQQVRDVMIPRSRMRSEEHTSELQSRGHLVCRLLLEKKKCKRSCHKTRRTTY